MDLAVALAGLALLLVAGDLLVRGAVGFSLRAGVPSLIVGLTVVAFGTSAPELLISVQAALDDAPGIALGNVVGSNIANILLVLGAPALISTLDGRASDTRKSYLFMIVVSVVFIALGFAGPLSWWHGLVLLSLLILMLADAFRDSRVGPDAEVEGVDPDAARMARGRIALFLVLGLIGLPAGAHLLIEGARNLALDLGISEAAIGLTLVAVGTSLPELATTVMAAFRREADVALGNVIGSNVFNLAAVMGVTALIADVPVGDEFLTRDLWVMLAASAVLAPFVMGKAVMTRWVGAAFLAAYVGYAALALGAAA